MPCTFFQYILIFSKKLHKTNCLFKDNVRASKEGVESVPSNATRREGSKASSKRSKTLAETKCAEGDDNLYTKKNENNDNVNIYNHARLHRILQNSILQLN